MLDTYVVVVVVFTTYINVVKMLDTYVVVVVVFATYINVL
jgi:hypothetical protein